MRAQVGDYEPDGEGFSVEGPDGTRHFEETPHEATPAWRRAQRLAAEMRATRSN